MKRKTLNKEEFVNLLKNMQFGDGYDIEVVGDGGDNEVSFITGVIKTRLIDSLVVIIGGTDGCEQIYNCGEGIVGENRYADIVDKIFEYFKDFNKDNKFSNNMTINLTNRFSVNMIFNGLELLRGDVTIDNNKLNEQYL